MSESEKIVAAKKALELKEVKEAKNLGIGTGSTVAFFIQEMPQEFIRDKMFVASSIDTSIRLKAKGAKLLDPRFVDEIDVYIDGADAIDIDGNLVKGGGAALFGEKLLALISKAFIVISDSSKVVEDLRRVSIPVEVHSFALTYALKRIESYGLKPKIRESLKGKFGPVISDFHGVIIDVDASRWSGDLKSLEEALKKIPGIIETGLFLQMADLIIIGDKVNVGKKSREKL